jgi:uncharacterized OB-fold protein
LVDMPVKDTILNRQDKAYRHARTDVVIVQREVHIKYKKSYGGMSRYIQGIMGAEHARLLYAICDKAEDHDDQKPLRFQVPRADCPECYAPTRWQELPGDTRFIVETFSTAVDLAGISFMDQLPVTVAWIKAILSDDKNTELDTLVAGMVLSEDYKELKKGDEVRPVFRKNPASNASDVMWVLLGTAFERFPSGYVESKNYPVRKIFK